MIKRGGDFYRPIPRIRTFKANDVRERDRGVRVYCEQSYGKKSTWILQVRAPMTLGSSGFGPEGKDFIIAGAPLGLADLRALRDAINAFIAVAEE